MLVKSKWLSKRPTKLFALVLGLFFSLSTYAGGKKGDPIDTQEEISAYIMHHLQDSHDFTLYSSAKTGKHYGFPLPVILWTSEGLVTFMSSEFQHDDNGEVIVEKNGLKFAKIHTKIYELNPGEDVVVFDDKHHATNAVRPLDLSITKSVVGMLLTAVLMFLGFVSLARGYKKGPIPTGVARGLEPLVIYVRDEIARPNIGDKKYRQFMGFLLTVFFFIWTLNLLGLTPLGFNVTGNIAVTFCLALCTFLITQFKANKDYWKHIFWMPGVPVPMKLILIPIELLGTLTRPFSLMIRLFANMSAGHIVVMSLISVMITLKVVMGPVASTGLSFVLSLFLTILEILIAFLQAFIFTMLSAVFIGMAVQDHEH
ncbi:ATP synthase F0 subcomplex A subunit [Arenibacter nanhaiticus]|uniref:ATP synthase subunit a n=1 Tax=Arenibacter nanhaiticus TaxID=558155 RepID=A0A1M6A5V1_9FLAO|nr:F0F1 ATP synthase subunit A [Arenibacter nanhaiticus]SHI31809.1 ATP synthase F0 subcomplex A subunit [Arenibacter nanhaiticus]